MVVGKRIRIPKGNEGPELQTQMLTAREGLELQIQITNARESPGVIWNNGTLLFLRFF